jgi:hypothetical protein
MQMDRDVQTIWMDWKILSAGEERHLHVAEEPVEPDDELLFIIGDVAPLDARPQVVEPPQPAALPAALQPCKTPLHRHIAICPCIALPVNSGSILALRVPVTGLGISHLVI